jgi:peptidoglycan hydrolase-like protein with peptidoglycan-binding domain
MNKTRLTVVSTLAFAGVMMATAPYSWSAGNDARMQKPSDSPAADTGMQSGRESHRAGGQQLSNEQAKKVQEALKSKGFDPGTADGVIGPKTNQAIRDFQKSNNLQVTGRIDDKTASALGVETNGMGRSGSSMGAAEDMKSNRSSSEKTEKGNRLPAKPDARGQE